MSYFNADTSLIRAAASRAVVASSKTHDGAVRWSHVHTLAFYAAMAVGNLQLAIDEMHADYTDIRERVEACDASELCEWLYDCGACCEGMTVCGPDIDYHQLDRILAYQGEWHDWYREQLAAELDEIPVDEREYDVGA